MAAVPQSNALAKTQRGSECRGRILVCLNPSYGGKTPDPTKSCGSNQQNVSILPIIRRHPELNFNDNFVISAQEMQVTNNLRTSQNPKAAGKL
jgi:copper homeostasis protein CutC